jgi:hypothetical protein
MHFIYNYEFLILSDEYMYIYLSEFVVVCKLEEVIIRWFKGMG